MEQLLLYTPRGSKRKTTLFDAPYGKNAKVHVALKHLKLRDGVDKPSLKVSDDVSGVHQTSRSCTDEVLRQLIAIVQDI